MTADYRTTDLGGNKTVVVVVVVGERTCANILLWPASLHSPLDHSVQYMDRAECAASGLGCMTQKQVISLL